jgi:hypothetical protein
VDDGVSDDAEARGGPVAREAVQIRVRALVRVEGRGVKEGPAERRRDEQAGQSNGRVVATGNHFAQVRVSPGYNLVKRAGRRPPGARTIGRFYRAGVGRTWTHICWPITRPPCLIFKQTR